MEVAAGRTGNFAKQCVLTCIGAVLGLQTPYLLTIMQVNRRHEPVRCKLRITMTALGWVSEKTAACLLADMHGSKL